MQVAIVALVVVGGAFLWEVLRMILGWPDWMYVGKRRHR